MIKRRKRSCFTSSQDLVVEDAWGLVPLAPEYLENEHGVYVTAITEAFQNPKICNIALSGNYGVGKSSILQKVVEQYHKQVVELSLSTLAPIEQSSLDASIPRQATTPTNRIQQEIVKQLLYREKPYNTPDSRFQRIERFRWLQESVVACVIGLIITVIFLLSGWTNQIAIEFTPLVDLGLWIHLVVLILAVSTVTVMRRIFYNRIHIRQLSAGSATVTLDEKSVSYFDQYLDEIVYFFEVSKRNIVIFEDIDRFNDSFIFETLRSLNALLNSSPQIKEPVRFIYAIKDSVFDQVSLEQSKRSIQQEYLNLEDSAQMEMVRANRTKFFDLIIPVVPFITHRNARDLVVQILQKVKHNIDEELIDIASRYVPDMRLLKNVRNEFIVFRERILTGEGQELKLNDSELFAMMLYKSTHMLDFEAIRIGESKIDKIYKVSREIVAENVQRIEREIRGIRSRLASLKGKSELSVMLGDKFIAHVDRTLRAHNYNTSNKQFSFNGKVRSEQEFREFDFWLEFVQGPKDSVVLVHHHYNHGRQSAQLSFMQADVMAALNIQLDKESLKSTYRNELEERLAGLLDDLKFLRVADMGELIRREGFFITDGDSKKTLKLIVCELLTDGLAYQLIRAGYINRNFTLYTSIFHGDRVSIAATNFIIHHIERNVMDEYFELEDSDVEAIIRECGVQNLDEPSFYNVSILDYALRANDDAAYLMVNSLAALNHNERRFLQAYLTNTKELKRFVKSFVSATSNALKYFSSQVELEDLVRVELISCAFEHLADEVRYKIDAVTKSYFEENYKKFPALTSTSLDDSMADKISKVFLDAEIRVSFLEHLSPVVQKAFISKNLYEISLKNLKVAIGQGESLALDNMYDQNRGVYDYVIKNLGLYLSAVQNVSVTIDSENLFADVIADVVRCDVSHLNEVVSLASSECLISDLSEVPESAWPVLALNNRFPATFANVSKYVELIGRVDSNLAKVLTSAEGLIDHDSVDEDDKARLAKVILNSSEHLPPPSLRVGLVESLSLDEFLDVENIPAENSELFGLLVERFILQDEAETYAYLSAMDWSTRECFIQASQRFSDYITPDLLRGDLVAFLKSSKIAKEIKFLIVERAEEFFEGSSKIELEHLARFAIQNQCQIPFEVVVELAGNKVSSQDVVFLLNPYLHKISYEQLYDVLQKLGDKYADLASLGKKQIKVSDTVPNRSLLDALVKHGVVSSYSADKRMLRVYRKHK